MGMTICYCFGYTDADIEADVVANKGESSILARIKTEKQQGGCRCHETNPSGK
ncbi:MAG: (2Fe-2S)-binding protein [Thermodesulfovibrionales bacterium]